MTTDATASDAALWRLIDQPQIDPMALASAIERELRNDHADFRTRLLIRDSVVALRQAWGEQRTTRWASRTPVADRLADLMRQDLGEAGFSSLRYRLMEQTRSETILQFLRELGSSLSEPAHFVIGRSIALILVRGLSRHTEDIDIVDEVPEPIRKRHDLLDGLIKRYGLRLAHFQSHYLPSGWEQRVKPLGRFGQLDVQLVDAYDIMLGKLFSKREKDRDDLRVLAGRLDKATLAARLADAGQKLLSESDLRNNAADNWYILFGELLPG